ncbi:hypothetical protein Syun_018852 [Stephania yunnanensis]|uniref:Pentatricopeptide repeat-containing protein n=1 Tax=Stephania yunnanensis TaxID=152371 RepID=A0AAP0ITN8_9MAGN
MSIITSQIDPVFWLNAPPLPSTPSSMKDNMTEEKVPTIVILTLSHSGLVREARDSMDSMSSIYGVDPIIDHYNGMVDIYSRAGQLEEALKLIQSMPFEPDVMSRYLS